MAFQKNFSKKALSITLLWLVLGSNIGLSQTTLTWADSLVVRTSQHYITAPRVKLLNDGIPIVIWGESSSPARIWCSRLENGLFSMPVSVVTTTPQPSLFGFGGFDVAVSGQQVFIVFERSNGIFLSKSDNGGRTFLPPVKVNTSATGSYATLASITTDESGNIFVNYILEKNSKATHQMQFSTDGGFIFSPAVEASEPADGTVVCECCIAVPLAAKGSVWLAFRNNNSNIRDHWVSRSSDLAATFDKAADIDDSNWQINVCPISGPRIVLAGDSLMIVWKTGTGGSSKVFVSSLDAATLQPGRQIRLGDSAHFSENQNQPDITAAGDTVGIVFQEGTRLALSFSLTGLSDLAKNYTHFEAFGQELRYPSLTYQAGNFYLVYTNSTTGEVTYRRGRLLPTVGIQGASTPAVFSVSVFPNPSDNGSFWLQSEAADLSDCTILDISGRQVAQKGLYGRLCKVEIPDCLPGIYYLKIKSIEGRETLCKLVVGFKKH